MVAVAGALPVVGAVVVFVVVDAVPLAVEAASLVVLVLFAGAQANTANASAAQMRFFTRPPSGGRMLCDVRKGGNHGRTSGLLTPELPGVVRMVISPSSA